MTEAWLCSYGKNVSHEFTHEFVRSLRTFQIAVHQTDDASGLEFGILLVGEINDGLLETVHSVSCRGKLQVLVVIYAATLPQRGHAWEILRAGACDVLIWQDHTEAVRTIAARLKRWSEVEMLISDYCKCHDLIGESPEWKKTIRQVTEIAHWSDASILILGESGTGKELIARLADAMNPQARCKDLVILDCSTLVPELAGSEFFGHERGAFTGAASTRDGAFASADGGTLFLDEIGELPLSLQPQLLRVVQEHTFRRVGSNTWNRTDFRLICATNRDLPVLAEKGEFRQDLYFRVAQWICRLPPLRERKADTLPLITHFLNQLIPAKPPPSIDEPVLHYLLSRDYPGNVRELKQLISRICYRHVGPGPITLGDLPDDERPASGGCANHWQTREFDHAIQHALTLGVGFKEISRSAGETAIRLAMDEAQGNLQQAAKRLGVTDRALQMRRAKQQESI